jgi:hypothetical protein
VAVSSRTHALLADLRSSFGRRHALAAGAASIAMLLFLVAAAPAGAVISGGFGLQRRAKGAVNFAPLQYHGGPVLHSSDSYAIYWDPAGAYRGDWKRLINRYFQDVGAASRSLGDVFAVDTQYTDGSGSAANQSTFRGGYTDENPYPTSENCTDAAMLACLTDQQIQAELQRVISSGALPGATGPAVYYLLTPPGVTVCTDSGGSGNCSDSTAPAKSPPNGICGYHSVINPSSVNPVVYAVQPWVAGDAGLLIESLVPLVTSGTSTDVLACQAGVAPLGEPNQLQGLNPFGNYAEGLADVIINDLSVEQDNVVVDPLLNGWYQSATAAEQSDMCRWNFGPPPETAPSEDDKTHAAPLTNETINGDHYFVQWAFDSTELTSGRGYWCWSGVSLEPHFTAPNPVNSGDVVGFDGTESLLTLQAAHQGLPADEPFSAPVYEWNFGDGTVVSGANQASQFHTYLYGGTYDVTLTVTDSGKNVSSFSKPITVVGPPPPAQGAGASGPGSSAAGAGSPSTAGPVVSASVVSRSLAIALRRGLSVRYSVNEQVAGRLEVLIATSTARRLGLRGPRAIGLAQGAAAQTVIGKEILVTTKGGRSAVKVQFDKQNAPRLRRLRKLSLMLRLVVRNRSAKTATVLSSVTLSR